MWTDAVEMRDFYDSMLGRVARRMIGRRVRDLWPDLRGLSVVGLGYATPFLGVFRSEAQRVLAVMPAGQGVVQWPREGRGLSTLADETALPFPDRSIDRILLVHALEGAEQTRPMMREVWRVLADGGRLLVVTSNRRGLWSRFERTPFGHGRPYSPRQLSKVVREAMFAPYQTAAALYVPPFHSRMILSSAAAWEKAGERWFTGFAGVAIVEATKEIYGGQIVFSEARNGAYAPAASR